MVEQTIPTNQQTPVVIRSADYKTVYSNLYRTRVGNGELTIVFSRATHTPSFLAEGNLIEEQTEIVMTWPQFKMLSMTLKSLLEAIESEVGPVEIPSGFLQNAAPGAESQRLAVKGLGLVRIPAPST
ncbi:MAG: DUF3467 domain-containing protein [Alphaproteobacteria bacterium]|nr:DUF3467 domain-containing protein [Alphaproteobacteria bacterium]